MITGAQLNNNQEFQITTGLHTTTTPKPIYLNKKDPIQSANDSTTFNFNNSSSIDNNTSEADKTNDIKSEDLPNDDARSRFRSFLSDYDDNDDNDNNNEENNSAESEERIDPAKHLNLDGEQIHAERIVFDRPFYWYLKDEVIGPVFTGLVNSFKTYKSEVVAVEEAFDDLFKYQFWSCAPKHLALMEAYNKAVAAQDEEDEDIGLADGLEDAEVSYDDLEE